MININDLTIGQVKEIMALAPALAAPSSAQEVGLNSMIGQAVIVRCYSAGNWFGTLTQKCKDEVILTNARRLWQWKCLQGTTLSEVATYGIDTEKSRVNGPVNEVWLQAIEIIPCTPGAAKIIEGAPYDAAK